jgi:hypothetical protein
MGIIHRLLSHLVARSLVRGNQTSIRIVFADQARVTVLIVPPGPKFSLARLSGLASGIDTVGIRAPEGWLRSDADADGKRWAEFSPPHPFSIPAPGTELTLEFDNASASPCSISVQLETRRTVGGSGSVMGFPAGWLLPEEVDAFNRRADLFSEAAKRGVIPRELPGWAALQSLEERARQARQTLR